MGSILAWTFGVILAVPIFFLVGVMAVMAGRLFWQWLTDDDSAPPPPPRKPVAKPSLKA